MLVTELDKKIKYRSGNSHMSFSALIGELKDVISELDQGADLYHQNNRRSTALMNAVNELSILSRNNKSEFHAKKANYYQIITILLNADLANHQTGNGDKNKQLLHIDNYLTNDPKFGRGILKITPGIYLEKLKTAFSDEPEAQELCNYLLPLFANYDRQIQACYLPVKSIGEEGPKPGQRVFTAQSSSTKPGFLQNLAMLLGFAGSTSQSSEHVPLLNHSSQALHSKVS